MNANSKRWKYRPCLEPLEDRLVPALVTSQVALKPPVLEPGEVKSLLGRAAAATASDDAIIAIVDRNGTILGVRVEGHVSTAITGNSDLLAFAIDGAVAEARTAAFFANDTAPLTPRTIQFISQSTVTEREVKSNPDGADPRNTGAGIGDPLENGPGFVAPVGDGGHFPPGIANTPQVDLFGIEHTNRDSFLLPGLDGIKGTADDIPLDSRFNILNFAPGKALSPPLAYGEAILSAADQKNPAVNHFQSRGIGTLPGGIPLYQYGVLIGGIGVFFPGETGYASEENSSLSNVSNANAPDRTLEAEFIGLAAAGGSTGAGFPVGTLGGIPKLVGFDIPFGSINLVGITLDVIGPGGLNGPSNLVHYANANLGVGQGNPNSGTDKPVDSLGNMYLKGKQVPQGWIVAPHAGVGISAADVRRIITQGITEANKVRAQIRLPNNNRTRMVLAVADSTGTVLGLYRMPDATVFSIDVAVAKARNTAYYNNAAQLQAVDQLPGVAAGTALTNRTFRFLAEPRYPEGIDGAPAGPFSILNDPGSNPITAVQVGPRQPITAFTSVFGYDSFHPGTNFHAPTSQKNQNGIVFFPGSSSVYKTVAGSQKIVGGFGVSGDGVDQDDVVTSFGINGYSAPSNIRADQVLFRTVRLPYQKFPRNPEG